MTMKLADVILDFVSGDWGEAVQGENCSNAVYCIRGADFVPISNSSYDDIPLRYISNKSQDIHSLQEGDIVIEKSGGSPTQSTGRVLFVSKELLDVKQPMVCSNFCVAIRVKEQWDPYYVYLYWQYLYSYGVFFNFEGKTSGIKNLQLDAALSTIEIEPKQMYIQKQIVNILSSIEQKIVLNRAINHNLPLQLILDRSSGVAEARLAVLRGRYW